MGGEKDPLFGEGTYCAKVVRGGKRLFQEKRGAITRGTLFKRRILFESLRYYPSWRGRGRTYASEKKGKTLLGRGSLSPKDFNWRHNINGGGKPSGRETDVECTPEKKKKNVWEGG